MARAFLPTVAALLMTSAALAPALADAGTGAVSKQVRMMFERFDSNGDGGICAVEFENVHLIRFYKLDMDKDGEISREEFVFMRGMRGVSEEHSNEAFERLDTKRNGRLSVQEFDTSKASAFAALDLNGDAVLSPSEVDQVVFAKGAKGLQ